MSNNEQVRFFRDAQNQLHTYIDLIEQEEKSRIKVHLVHTWYDNNELSGWCWYTDDHRRCERAFRTIEQCNNDVLEQEWFDSNYEVEWHVFTLHQEQVENTLKHIALVRIERLLEEHHSNHPNNHDVIECLDFTYSLSDIEKMFFTPDGSILVDIVLDYAVTLENIVLWAFMKFTDQVEEGTIQFDTE